MIGEGCFWLKRTASEFDREGESSGSVFKDFGFEDGEAEILRVGPT
jgi:hypothetical protein